MLKRIAEFLPIAKWRFQRWLVRCGLVFFRVPRTATLPPTPTQYLKELAERHPAVSAAVSFDDEPQVQRELLGAFPASQVNFLSMSASDATRALFSELSAARRPATSFLVEADGETYDVFQLLADQPWLAQAEVILVRCTLGHFWSGQGDLQSLVRGLARQGFEFCDVLEFFKLHLLNAPQARVMLVFEKKHLVARAGSSAPVDEERARRSRRHQALVFLSRPLATTADLTRLAGRGSLGFAAGILNPGAIARGDKICLLARGEQIPWVQAKEDVATFLRSCRPVFYELDRDLTVTQAQAGTVVETPASRGTRLEDFRLFQFRGELFVNHSQLTPFNRPTDGAVKPVVFENSRIGVALSRLDTSAKKMTLMGNPTVDFPTGAAEKNWVMFEHEAALYLIYSLNPFHLLKASNWPELSFATVHRETLDLPDSGDGLKFRNSANPVAYDAHHFLHMVHKVYPDKRYAFWGVLIEKSSLLPKKISARPLVCGWQSSPAPIIYACSLVVRPAEVLVFGGLNDTGLGYWNIPREKLDAAWLPLAEFL